MILVREEFLLSFEVVEMIRIDLIVLMVLKTESCSFQLAYHCLFLQILGYQTSLCL